MNEVGTKRLFTTIALIIGLSSGIAMANCKARVGNNLWGLFLDSSERQKKKLPARVPFVAQASANV